MAELYWIKTAEMTDMFTEGYIGMSTISAKHRWKAHVHASKCSDKAHLPIYKAFKKYGVENLVMSVLVVGDETYILSLEESLRPSERIGWNLAMGGQDTGKGRTHTPEEIAKRADSIRGLKRTEETKRRMSLASKGVPKSEAHKERLRQANLGKIASDETKRKMSESRTGNYIPTEEHRQKISLRQKALKTWEHSKANQMLWSSAKQIFQLSQTMEVFSPRYLAKEVGLRDSEVITIVKKIKSGWNPSEDLSYLAWLEKYNKQKECPNGT